MLNLQQFGSVAKLFYNLIGAIVLLHHEITVVTLEIMGYDGYILRVLLC